MVRIFLSHSSHDLALVERLVELLRVSLNISSTEIRCTSVDGYRLPAGADTADQLRTEVLEAPVFLGLISEASFESAYVLFELGARWGTRKGLIPLLAPGLEPRMLRGPLATLNALRCDSAAQLHQLVADLARELNLTPEPAAAYQRYIDSIRAHQPAPQDARAMTRPPSPPTRPAEVDDEPGPFDIPSHVFQGIRTKAQRRYPDNFTMQEFAEQQEIDAYRRLHPPAR